MIEAQSRALASVTNLIDQLRASGLPTDMATHILDKLSALQANATVKTVEPASHERRHRASSEVAR